MKSSTFQELVLLFWAMMANQKNMLPSLVRGLQPYMGLKFLGNPR